MRNIFKGRSGYWLGRVLSIWSLLATVLILIGIVALPILAGQLIDLGEEALSEASDRAAEAARTARHAEDTLQKTSVALDASLSAMEAAQANLDEIEPLLESIQFLLGEEAPNTITATQGALESAQSGARAMDQMLRVLSSLRFLTGVSYAPEQPLDEALQGVSDSLVPMPTALISVSKEIETFGETLDRLKPEFDEALKGVSSMSASLRTMALSLSRSIDGLESLSGSLEIQTKTFERKVWIGLVVAELILLQMALLQFMSAYIGDMLLRQSQSKLD